MIRVAINGFGRIGRLAFREIITGTDFRNGFVDYSTCVYVSKERYEMDEKRKGKFSRHLIKDSEMRDVLDFTLKASEDRYAKFANKINGQHILLVDDTISRGQTIMEACRIMRESYAPKSITVLTLLSKL